MKPVSAIVTNPYLGVSIVLASHGADIAHEETIDDWDRYTLKEITRIIHERAAIRFELEFCYRLPAVSPYKI